MIIRWSETAVRHLEAIHAYIAQDNADAATTTAAKILNAVEQLAKQPWLGRPGRHPETRELIHASYVIVYRVDQERECVHIESVLHGKRRYD